MVIWDLKTLAPELAIGEVPGTIYGLSAKGWIDHKLFDFWFNNQFFFAICTNCKANIALVRWSFLPLLS